MAGWYGACSASSPRRWLLQLQLTPSQPWAIRRFDSCYSLTASVLLSTHSGMFRRCNIITLDAFALDMPIFEETFKLDVYICMTSCCRRRAVPEEEAAQSMQWRASSGSTRRRT